MISAVYPTIDLVATGNRIKQLRLAKGLKVSDLSEFMGFAEPQAVYKWQRGESLPTVDNLYALSKILGTTMEDILVGDDGCPSVICRKRQNGGKIFFLTNGVKKSNIIYNLTL